MPKIAIIKDNFSPTLQSDLRKAFEEVQEGSTAWDYLESKFPGFAGFSQPTICKIGFGESYLSQKDWKTYELKKDDVLVFIPVAGASVVIAIVIAIIVAVAVFLFLDFPVPTIDGQPESDPVYSFRGQQNQVKQGEAIEKHYGQVRHWPSYAARPYNQIINNDQYLFALFAVGLGEYEIEKVLVDDTEVESLQEIEYEICLPGEQVTLFPTNVQTSPEVGGVELVAPNEDDYDWSGGYVLNNSGSRCYRIELDLSFRQGLYRTDDKGRLRAVSVTSEFEYRLIDDAGDPLGEWESLTPFDKSLATTNMSRYTVGVDVNPGRYEVRGRRTNDKPGDFKVRDSLFWEQARAFCETKQDFGNVTLLAIKAKATDNLNDNSRNRFNVRLKSIVDVYEDGVWAPQVSRNPVWAACDVLRKEYGRNLPSSFLEMEILKPLATQLDEDEIYFDWTFDQRGTVWPALQIIMMICRAKPVIPNALFSAVRDVPIEIPSLGFNPHNIIKDSFSVSTNLSNYGDHDGIEVEYINPENWTKETVTCLLEDDEGINLKQVRLSGCTDRNVAYRWGLYTRATELYQRENISFETGIEAATAIYGDLCVLQHDLLPIDFDIPKEFTGRLSHDAFDNSGDSTKIQLPKPVEFEDGEVYRIALRDRLGIIRGPYVCEMTEDTSIISLEITLDLSMFEVDGHSEPATFFIGKSGQEMLLAKIIKLEPAGDNQIKLTVVPTDPRIYTFDAAIAPPIDLPPRPPQIPSAPVVENLNVIGVADSLFEVLASWSPALGASSYVVEISFNGVDFSTHAQTQTTSSRIAFGEAGTMWVRVYAVGLLAGPFATWTGEVGSPITPPGKTEGLALNGAFNTSALNLLWDENPLAELYAVRFYIGAAFLAEKLTVEPRYSYEAATAQSDAIAEGLTLAGTVIVEVVAVNTEGEGEPSDQLTATTTHPDWN